MTLNQIKKIFLAVTISALFWGNTFAQDSQTLYYMNRVPQSTMMNPAMQPTCNFFFGLPVVSSLQLNFGNNHLALTDVIMKHPTEDSLITFLHPDAEFNTTDFLNKLDKNNFFYEDFRTDLLSFGFRVNTWYFSLNISEKVSAAINYPKDLLAFALQGNSQFVNSEANFNSLGVNLSFYREYGLGVSKEINESLTVGIRAKVLFGHANVYSDFDQNNIGIYSSRDSLHINANAEANITVPDQSIFELDVVDVPGPGPWEGVIANLNQDIGTDTLIDLALAHNNMGFGIDFGANYKPLEKLLISLSVIDLGYIKWEDPNVSTLKLDGRYSYTGVNMNDDEGGLVDYNDAFNTMLDSMNNSFTISETGKSYTTSLGAKIYLGGSYALSKKFDVGFLSRTYFYNSYVNQAFTFSANVRPINGLSASLSYSIMNGTYNNIGFGLVLGGAPIQLYIISDNASAALWGHKTSSFNLRFGLNVAFGCRQKSKANKIDRPMLKSVF